MARFRAFVRNDNLVIITGLKKAVDGSFMNSASVAFTVLDRKGVEVLFDNTADEWPRAMEYIIGSEGDYVGTIPSEALLDTDQEYIARVTGAQDGIRFEFDIFFVASERKITHV